MSTPITTLTLYRTFLNNDNIVLDSKHHTEYLQYLETQGLSYQVTNCTFQRQNRNMRLPLSMDIAGRYNYGSFINNGRKFYCFITDMEYVNDNMTSATYTMDWWHTYQDDIQYKPTMIARKIVAEADDIIGKYTAEEPPEATVFTLYNSMDTFERSDSLLTGSWYILYDNGTQLSFDNGDVPYGVHGFSGRVLVTDELSEVTSRLNAMASINDGLDSIQGFWNVPKAAFQNLSKGTTATNLGNPSYNGFGILHAPTHSGSYTIRNKKCKIAPYTYFYVWSSDGNDLAIRPQDIGPQGAEDYTFMLMAAVVPAPCLMVEPQIAFGQPNRSHLMSLSCENFVTPNMMASVVSVSRALNAVGSAISLASGAMYQGASRDLIRANMTATSLANGRAAGLSKNMGFLTGTDQKRADALYAGNTAQTIGNVGGAAVNLAKDLTHLKTITGVKGKGNACEWQFGGVGIAVAQYVVDEEQMKAADMFFSRYGYAINEIQEIELHNRSNWDYVQTSGASLTVPTAPIEAQDAINAMFDSGLTLFHNYTLFKRFDGPNH